MFETLERERTGNRVYLDTAYYRRFERWLKSEYNCDVRIGGLLEFEDNRDATMFILRWSE